MEFRGMVAPRVTDAFMHSGVTVYTSCTDQLPRNYYAFFNFEESF